MAQQLTARPSGGLSARCQPVARRG
jgi:hypothetical protein